MPREKVIKNTLALFAEHLSKNSTKPFIEKIHDIEEDCIPTNADEIDSMIKFGLEESVLDQIREKN